RMPEAVPAPRIERAVVARFKHGFKHIVVLDNVPAPCPVSNINAGTRYMVNGVMAHMNPRGKLNLHASHLLFYGTNVTDKVIFYRTICWISIAFRAWDGIHVACMHKLFIAKGRRTDSIGAAH